MSLLNPNTQHAVEPVAAGSTLGGASNAAPETQEEDLQALIDEQAARKAARRRRGNLMLLGVVVALMAAGGGAYGFMPEARRQVDQIAADLMLVGRDLRLASDPVEMRKAYDKSLEKIGTRATAVDNATRSLGIDPTTVTDNDLEAEEQQLMGDGVQTVSGRNRLLQAKLGGMVKNYPNGEPATPGSAPQPSSPKPAAPSPAPTPAPAPTPTPAKPAAPVVHDQPLIIR